MEDIDEIEDMEDINNIYYPILSIGLYGENRKIF